MLRTIRHLGLAAARWSLIAILTACGAAATSPSSEAAPSVTESPSASPSPEIDVASAFAEIMGSSTFSVESQISGSIEVGAGEGAISGSLVADAGGNHLVMEITLPGQASQVTETINAGGMSYRREGDLWFLAGDVSNGDDSFAADLGNLESLRDEGVVERDGDRLHRLVPSQPLDLDASSLGFDDPSVSGFQADVEFFATDDGTPAGLVISAQWEQDVNGEPMDATMTLDYAFTSVGEAVDIVAPEELWLKFTSDAFGYQMAYPSTWDFQHFPAEGEFPAADVFLAPATVGAVATEVDVYHYPDLEAGIVPNAWFRDSGLLLEETWGTSLETSELIEVNGIEAQLFTLHGVQEGGNDTYFQEAAIFAGSVAWDVDWYSQPGMEMADRELFVKMLSTFRPTQ